MHDGAVTPAANPDANSAATPAAIPVAIPDVNPGANPGVSPDRPGLSTGAPADAPRRIVHPPVGPYQCWIDGDLLRATGIRYAVAERFGTPHPAPDHAEVLPALTWSPAAPQTVGPMGDVLFGPSTRVLEVDEHCQFLSVTAPADAAPGDDLHVIVWIHGGSNVTGAGDISYADPGSLVREQRVVVVTVTYRLGALGYVGTDSRPAHRGLLDQAVALRWVRRNIGAFGGDPQAVTAMGESAGADAIAHLLAAFPEEPLCDRAILQSPPLGLRRHRSRMTRVASAVVRGLDQDSTLEELLATESRIQNRVLRFGWPGMMPFGVEYGRDPLPPEDRVEDAWRQAAPRVPLLLTSMAQEMAVFTQQVPALVRLMRHRWFEQHLVTPVERWATEAIFFRGADELARLWADAGGQTHRGVITWAAAGNRYGSAHGMEVPLQFGDRHVWEHAALLRGSRWEEMERAGRELRARWGAFARGQAVDGEVPGVIDIHPVERA